MAATDISKDDILILLASMGVVLGKDTKMPFEELNKRLGQSLDTSQALSDHFSESTVDPSSLPRWSSQKTLFEASQRKNISETMMSAMSRPKLGNLSTKEDTFKELRQSILSIAYVSDEKMNEVFFVDAQRQWGIYVRVLEIHQLKDDVPLFVLMYKDLISTAEKSLDDLLDSINPGAHATSKISDLERWMMLRLFQINAKHLSSTYISSKEVMKTVKKIGFLPTFVLPLGPIGMRKLGKLTKDPGCDVCGKKNANRCMQCMSVSYCSKECQKSDWPIHKLVCKSVKGGTWSTISVTRPPLPHFSLINRLESLGSPSSVGYSPTGAPPDVHNGKIFLAKFQVALSDSPHSADMMIYDRKQSFHFFWKRSTNPNLFDDARRRIGDKFKFYRWVKRTGDYELQICLDRGPEQDPLW